MKISAVITTKNEEKNIKDCLESIAKQDFAGEIEIIVVDNHSQDKTGEIAEKYTNLVFVAGPERSSQRNFGVAKASSDWFIFLDADMRLSAGVIRSCVEKIKNDDKIVAIYIPEKIIGKGRFSKIRNFERTFYDGTVIDAPRFIKKSVFEKVGGFDEDLYACEDWDLAKRLKKEGATTIIENPLFHDEKDLTLKKYLQKKRYYSNNFEKYFEKWGKNDPDIKKQFGFCYRFFGVFTENGKWKKLLMRPDLALGMWGLRFLVGLEYVFSRRKNVKNRSVIS